MNSSILILQGFSNSLETPVLWKSMAALAFYCFSAEYKKIKRITWLLLVIRPKGKRYSNSLGRGGELYMGGLNNTLETMTLFSWNPQ